MATARKQSVVKAWHGYGTRAAYHLATPHIVVLQGAHKHNGRHTCMPVRFESVVRADAMAARMRKAGVTVLAQVVDPVGNGLEGIAEPLYPHYVIAA